MCPAGVVYGLPVELQREDCGQSQRCVSTFRFLTAYRYMSKTYLTLLTSHPAATAVLQIAEPTGEIESVTSHDRY